MNPVRIWRLNSYCRPVSFVYYATNKPDSQMFHENEKLQQLVAVNFREPDFY